MKKKFTGITSDSRVVKPGFVYVAIRGSHLNGESFIDDAIKNGAVKIVTSKDYPHKHLEGVELLKVTDTREYIAKASAEFYDHQQPENVVAITGTNGKTSVASMFRQICLFLGDNSASIGTLGIESNVDLKFDYPILTSPDATHLHDILAIMKAKNIKYVALEASSHGLEQRRMDGVRIKSAAFTNFSQDHLDFHNSMEEYFTAKVRLFKELTLENAVLNTDIPEYKQLLTAAKKRSLNIISYGKKAKDIKYLAKKSEVLTLQINGQKYDFTFHPIGEFQIYNFMAAIGLAICSGYKIEQIQKISAKIVAAPGRLEYIASYSNAKVFIDYAHTPDALENALAALRQELDTPGKLRLVFGAGGNRDKSKRRLMGQEAAKLADDIIITDDNPRDENPSQIHEDIKSGCPDAHVIADRKEAIDFALSRCKSSDILLVAGKGHENYQIICDKVLPFSDKETIKSLISNKVGGMQHLFCFGYGYVAQKLARLLAASEGKWSFSGTKRSKTKDDFATIYEFDTLLNLPRDTTHVLVSIPPSESGDLALNKFAKHLEKLPNLQWIGYFSTTGVYGDTQGEWVNEESKVSPSNEFSARRAKAEAAWQALADKMNIPLFIFRLSGTYGPGRSAIDLILNGKVKIIDKKEQVFSRIHLHDIAHAVQLAIHNPSAAGIYNLADDYPCNPKELIEYTCKLLNVEPPEPISLEDANLSKMGLIFYNECRRVSNEKVKKSLGLKLKFPTYKEGILHILNN